MRIRLFAVVGLLALGQGCTTEPVRTDADFGNSVRQMIAVQRVDGTGPVRSSYDGRQAEKVLQTWRSNVGSPQDLKTDVNVQLSK